MSNLITELKRRNVFRVAAAYVVGGWILIQTSDALFPALNLPDWTTRFVAGLVVLGFPVALIMSWAFEVTPDGVKRDTGELSSDGSSSKRLDILTLIGVAIVIALVVWQKLDAPNRPQPEVAQKITVTESAPSVAVLAFENMSPDPANEFFAEGISEEILNVLAGIDGLKVASRTSAFSFANSDAPIPEIARKLSVNHVLEGSVRKQGMRVRITAQLIDASNDRHLWSDTYDRELDDIFVVQEEIAQAISEALLGALGMEQVSVDASTNDLVAYELFLSGRRSFYRRGTEELERSIVDLSAAVARDPEFADAWSFRAAAQHTSTGYG
jgi:TolB-like protein